MSKREFKVGDEVKIKPNTRYYGLSSSNPSKKIGKITNIGDTSKYTDYRNISVRWDKYNSNVYNKNDLNFASNISYPDE